MFQITFFGGLWEISKGFLAIFMVGVVFMILYGIVKKKLVKPDSRLGEFMESHEGHEVFIVILILTALVYYILF